MSEQDSEPRESNPFEQAIALLQERIPELRNQLQVTTERERVQLPPHYERLVATEPELAAEHGYREWQTVQQVFLPAAPEAEYCFAFWVIVETLCFGVAAKPQPPVEGSDEIWFMYGEAFSYGEGDQYVQSVCGLAIDVLTRPTRIVQRKRRRYWELQCDILKDGEWVHWNWANGGRDCRPIGRWVPPFISGSEHVYHAPALFPQYAGLWDRPEPELGMFSTEKLFSCSSVSGAVLFGLLLVLLMTEYCG